MATIPAPETIPVRRGSEAQLAAAIELGWRVAELHALNPSRLGPAPDLPDDLLLNRRNLPAADRLELELRAIAGVAENVGVPVDADVRNELLGLAAQAPASADGQRRFRERLAQLHIDIEKQLWAEEEDRGRAYEVGNFLSDTWNRVVRAHEAPEAELQKIFAKQRVERMKVLLDNLQGRLDPAAVHVVNNHLDSWHETIAGRSVPEPSVTAAEVEERYEPVYRQTLIWRQMLTGAKEPEAFIGREERAEVRDELTRQLWLRYLKRFWWVILIVAAVGAGAGLLIASDSDKTAAVIGTLTAIGGMLGVTRASMTAAVKRGLQTWGELMWNRALAAVICRVTLVAGKLPGSS